MSTTANLPGWWEYLYHVKPTLNRDGITWSASIGFVTTQANLIPFVTVISGLAQTIVTSGVSMARIVPLQHPLYSTLWAKRIRVEMFGEASATSSALQDLHSHAKVTVEFESFAFPTNGDQAYMTWTVRGSGQYATIPNRKLTFSNGEVLGQDAGQFIGRTDYNLTLYQCDGLNDALLDGAKGKVNSAIFRGKAVGTLLFQTWEATYELLVGGGLHYTKQLVMSHQSHEWNKFYRSDGVLDTATDPASNPIYDSTDFSLILG